MTEGKAGARLKVLSTLVVVMFLALTTRLWFLQVLATERYRVLAASNSVRLMELPAPRGRILDAEGRELVKNRMSLEVTVNRQELGERAEEVVLRLAELLRMPVEELRERLDDPRYYSFQPVPVAVDVSKRVAFFIAERQADFPGVATVEAPVREYPHGKLAAHVLGYLGQISGEQLEEPRYRDYGQSDLIGQAGVEAVYERHLRGTKGIVKYLVNAAGDNIRSIGRRAPEAGNDLVLTIDLETQRLAEESLGLGLEHARGIVDRETGRYLTANAGAVIVMEPSTGAVRALASWPTYRPALFVGGVSQLDYQRLFNNPATGYPLLNRAIAGQYPPGSTFKPFVALSAMRRGLLSSSGYYPCPPVYVYQSDIETRVWRNWSSANYGSITLARALSISCDTVFYPLGKYYWDIYYPPTSPAKEPLQKDLAALGFGRDTGVDLPGEREGRIPDAEWKAVIHRHYPKLFPFGDWFPGDFINMTIGQGDVLATPLQIATAYSAVANGGRICQPRLALRAQRVDGEVVRKIRPRCGTKVPFSANQLAYVRNALRDVPVSGTAAGAFAAFPFSEVQVAGKTGTAQVPPPRQDVSWFAAIASDGEQEFVVVAAVEQGGHGSTTAAPIVRRVIEGLFGLPGSGFLTVGGTD